MNGEDIVKKK